MSESDAVKTAPAGWVIGVMLAAGDQPTQRHYYAVGHADRAKAEWTAIDWAVRAGSSAFGFLDRFGFRPGSHLQEMGRGYASLVEQDARLAFINTLRAVIDAGGQKVSAMDRLYLAERMPMLIIWGDRDPIIPVEHGRRAHAEIPHSSMVEIPGARHWPQLDQPRRVCRELTRFIEETEPFVYDVGFMREQLRQGPPAR